MEVKETKRGSRVQWSSVRIGNILITSVIFAFLSVLFVFFIPNENQRNWRRLKRSRDSNAKKKKKHPINRRSGVISMPVCFNRAGRSVKVSAQVCVCVCALA